MPTRTPPLVLGLVRWGCDEAEVVLLRSGWATAPGRVELRCLVCGQMSGALSLHEVAGELRAYVVGSS